MHLLPIGPKSLATTAPRSGKYTIAWFLRLLALAVPLAVIAVAVIVGPSWFAAQPRELRRALIERLLRALLVVDGSLFLLGVVGTALFGWLMILAWRRRTRASI